ncbi:hypothetical protein BC628DRAFT_780296 [Trametes gibbosa]|nr:hypothetical protein BC628DRAFT_780296 [Trametes gibbosa]
MSATSGWSPSQPHSPVICGIGLCTSYARSLVKPAHRKTGLAGRATRASVLVSNKLPALTRSPEYAFISQRNKRRRARPQKPRRTASASPHPSLAPSRNHMPISTVDWGPARARASTTRRASQTGTLPSSDRMHALLLTTSREDARAKFGFCDRPLCLNSTRPSQMSKEHSDVRQACEEASGSSWGRARSRA